LGGLVTLSVGVIGYNEGNGHPFSFSAIINGYSDDGFARADWSVIHDYLNQRDPGEFGFDDVRVTHAWTQDDAVTRRLCDACYIENAVERPDQMIGEVDAILLCRHDSETHREFAMPFLEAGLPVFVDKPLSLDIEDLRIFRPFLDGGKLMSCSGLRYARELDNAAAALSSFGSIKLVRASVVLDWEKYGVHMVDAALGLGWATPVSIQRLSAQHDSFAVEMDDGSLLQIDALGVVPKVFRLDIYGTQKEESLQLFDNFTAFRRTIGHFLDMARTGIPSIPAETVLTSMRLLIAGRKAEREGRAVPLSEITI
jgi:predicted dehydrogenase